jgi:penicillin-binding protein 2
MKFIDTSQNLRIRLLTVQMTAVLLLGLLGVRLYLLQVVRGSYYGEIAQNQRIRLLPIPAPRGIIFDRNGRPLVDSRPIYTVILSREDARKDLATLVSPLAEGLNLDPDLLRERFEEIKSLPSFESVPIKQDATPGDIAWVEARELEFPELRIEQQPQRFYPADGSLAHVVGYVGEIGPEQLKQTAYRDKKLKPGDVI